MKLKKRWLIKQQETDRSMYAWLALQWLLRDLLWNDQLQVGIRFLWCVQLMHWLLRKFFRGSEMKPAFSVFWDFFYVHGIKTENVFFVFITYIILTYFCLVNAAIPLQDISNHQYFQVHNEDDAHISVGILEFS